MTPKERWQQGLAGEISFWEKVREYHPEWFAAGMDASRPLDEDVDAALQSSGHTALCLLDVGCGMISTMGKVSRIGIVPRILYLDPLKHEFDRIAREQGFKLPVIPISPVCIEDLPLTPAIFTVIYSRNAIDHCFDPAKAIQNMASMLMPGGSLVLKHYYRCADRNNHESLHQWNFFDDSGEMWLEGYGTTVSVLSLVSPCEQVAVDRYNEGPELLIRAIYRKPIL